jgi:sec-independent protein translocase protein TatA
MHPMMAVLSGTHVVLVAVIVLLLFGAQKIPQLMRSVGSGLTEFKKGLKEGEQALWSEATAPTPPPQPGTDREPAQARTEAPREPTLPRSG